MVGGSLIERLTEVSNRQILLKIAALWGGCVFRNQENRKHSHPGPRVRRSLGALCEPSFVQEFMKRKPLGCLRAGLVIPGREPMEQNARQQRTDRVDQRKVGILL